MAPVISRLAVAFSALLMSAVSSLAQGFSITPSQVDLAVAPGYNHADVGVPISASGGFDFSTLTVASDASWVTASVDGAKSEVRLVFNSGGLIASSNTATITVNGPGGTDSFYVKASVAPLNIVKLIDDPVRSRAYGVQQNGINQGCVVAFDPITNTPVSSVSVGKKPADLAISQDGSEMLVINCADKSISVIDLFTLRLKDTIALAVYDNWGVNDTTADVAYGPGSTIYYTDGGWAPTLRVFDRTTRTVTQSVLDSSYGFGDFALTPDGQTLIGWIQYGWSAGIASSYIVRYSVDAQGKLTFKERTTSVYPTAVNRDPLDAPVLIDEDQEVAFVKELGVDPASVLNNLTRFPKPVYSISPRGEIAATTNGIYETETGLSLYTLPITAPVQAITNDYARFIYFNPTLRTINTINLLETIGPEILNQKLTPADGSITLAPTKLEWTSLPGVDRYRVYFGTDSSVVESATVNSPAYLGEASSALIALDESLNAGTTYYWRVDAIYASGEVKGGVYRFTVSPIAASQSSIKTYTVTGHSAHKVELQLTAPDGLTWEATGSKSWISFATSTGTGSGTLSVIVDASQLTPGVHSGEVAVKAGTQPAFTIPLTVDVESLNLTVMESDRTSSTIYAVSEVANSNRAYLLELDSQDQAIRRVVRVGSSVTDLAVHSAEGRVYVTNWSTGSLLAIDKTTFKQVRAYSFSPFGQIGYGQNDVYKVSAGIAGRLMVEEYDQWIDLSIYDTATGTKLANRASVREGGGDYAAGGRYYYHGENNSSGAELRKYDTVGDTFTELAHARVTAVSYYGSRTVVVSENGNRIFWNGAVFRPDLSVEWSIGAEIFSSSPDGRYAFGQTKVYDVETKQVVLNMPASTKVSAYNSTTKRLAVQVGQAVKFFTIDGLTAVTAPTLALNTVTAQTVKLTWTGDLLASGFTLQMRKVGVADWQDVGTISSSATSYTVYSLTPQTSYEFRIKADAGAGSSPWSNIVTATTGAIPLPGTPVLAIRALGTVYVTLGWNDISNETGFTVQMRLAGTSDWQEVGSPWANATSYMVQGLTPLTSYEFQIKANSAAGSSGWSNTVAATTVTVPPPSVPSLSITSSSSTSVTLGWNDVGQHTGFTIQKRVAGTDDWLPVATIGSGQTSYTVNGLNANTAYEFRMKSVNGSASSDWSTTATGTTPPTPPDPVAYSKLIYKMSGRGQQWGEDATMAKTISGYFVWEPETGRGAQLVVHGTAKSGAYFLYEGTFEARQLSVARGGILMAFPAVNSWGDDSTSQIEASLMRGTATNVKVGSETFLIPRTMTGKGWAIGLGDSDQILLETVETYSLDIAGSASSNAAGEFFDDVVERLTKKITDKGYRPVESESLNLAPTLPPTSNNNFPSGSTSGTISGNVSWTSGATLTLTGGGFIAFPQHPPIVATPAP